MSSVSVDEKFNFRSEEARGKMLANIFDRVLSSRRATSYLG